MERKIFFGELFHDHIRKFTDKQKALIFSKAKLLSLDIDHNSLRTRKLHGRKNTYESSVTMKIRLIWQLDGNRILVEDVGYHDILKIYG